MSDAEPEDRRRFSAGKLLAIFGGVVAAAATGVGILFQVEPQLAPCLGGTSASITVAVLPINAGDYYDFHQDQLSKALTPKERSALVADMSYTLNTSGFRHHDLQLAYSLLSIGKDGSTRAVVPGEYRLPLNPFKPSDCSDQRGFDDPIQVPDPKKRYRLLVEVFDQALTNAALDTANRITYTDSNTFELTG